MADWTAAGLHSSMLSTPAHRLTDSTTAARENNDVEWRRQHIMSRQVGSVSGDVTRPPSLLSLSREEENLRCFVDGIINRSVLDNNRDIYQHWIVRDVKPIECHLRQEAYR